MSDDDDARFSTALEKVCNEVLKSRGKKTVFVATTLIGAKADISLKSGYSHNSNNIESKSYYALKQQKEILNQQPQYLMQNIISNFLTGPGTQYLPQPQDQHEPHVQLQLQHNQRYVTPQTNQEQQQQQQHQHQHQFDKQHPMPVDFPSLFSHQPIVNTKPARLYRPRMRISKKPIVTKHFFIHSAPEENQAEINKELAILQQQQQPRKHYNVLFVKIPSQTNKAAALSLAKALNEEKTVVYVLAKKTSAADLQKAVQESLQHISKPEVFFIKYRTPKEAANVQRQIQSQYNSLDGTTTIMDEGIASNNSVIGSLDASKEEEDQQKNQQQQQLQQDLLAESKDQIQNEQQLGNSLASNHNNSYLPPPNQ